MNHDVEQLFGRLTPRGVSAELRPRVLAAVADELQAAPPSAWLRWSALGVAASILVGVAMNLWAIKVSERRLAQLYGPPPISKQAMEVARAVEEITDVQTAQWVYRRLAVRPASNNGPAAYAAYCAAVKQLIDQMQIVSKGCYHATPQADSQMDRSNSGCPGGDQSGCQRGFRLDYRFTA